MPENCKICIMGFLFLLFPFTFLHAQNSVVGDIDYSAFQKECEYQINLLRSHTDKPDKLEKVYAKMPSWLFGKTLSDSSFVAFGVSDPIEDTALAYKMATSRALLMANLLIGIDLTVFYNYYSADEVSPKSNLNSRFSQYYVVECKKNISLKDSLIKLRNIRLESGETIVLIYKDDLKQKTGITDNKKFEFNIWLSEYRHNNRYEPIKRISLKSNNKQLGLSSYIFSSSGKLSIAYTLISDDSISNGSKFYVYKNTDNSGIDSTYSLYPLNNGIWTAYINTLVNEIIKNVSNVNGGHFTSMTDLYNNQLKSYSQNLKTQVELKLGIEEIKLFNNDFYLKTINKFK